MLKLQGTLSFSSGKIRTVLSLLSEKFKMWLWGCFWTFYSPRADIHEDWATSLSLSFVLLLTTAFLKRSDCLVPRICSNFDGHFRLPFQTFIEFWSFLPSAEITSVDQSDSLQHALKLRSDFWTELTAEDTWKRPCRHVWICIVKSDELQVWAEL